MIAIHKDLINPEYVKWLDFLRKADSWSVERIRQYETAQLRGIAEFAYKNSTGYRDRFDAAGVRPSNISEPEDIRSFPFLTKNDIRDRLEDFSAAFPERFYITTGGSTG